MRDAPPPGNVKDKDPSMALYTTVNAPALAYAKLVHETPVCSSLRVPEAATKSTNVRPVNLSTVIVDVGVKDTETVTFGAFAIDEDTPTVEPPIMVEKMAGNDPCELAAIKLPAAFRMAASTASLPGKTFAGRLKVPKDNVSRVLAEISAPKTNSISEDVPGIREEETMLFAPPDGAITVTEGGDGSPVRG